MNQPLHIDDIENRLVSISSRIARVCDKTVRMLEYSSTLARSIMSAIHLSGSEFHPPTDGSVRWRGLESHGLPVGGLDVLKREVRQIFL